MEFKQPESVKCSGKGHPALSYVWKKQGGTDLISKKDVLQLEPMSRSDSGGYVCEASNRHGTSSITVYFNVLCKFYKLYLFTNEEIMTDFDTFVRFSWSNSTVNSYRALYNVL